MSDLFCPATLVVVRHAEAEYDTELVGDHGGSLTVAGRTQARDLGRSMLGRRVAGIWCSDMARAVQTAEIAAAEIAAAEMEVGVRVRPGLREFAVGGYAGEPFTDATFKTVQSAWLAGDLSAGCPGAESGAEVVHRMSAELSGARDQFRGETVLIVSHGGAMSLTLPRLARNVSDAWLARRLPPAAGCELVADADGWVLRSWAGEPV